MDVGCSVGLRVIGLIAGIGLIAVIGLIAGYRVGMDVGCSVGLRVACFVGFQLHFDANS